MMRRFGLPVLPLIIGVILGPRIERQLRQSLQLGGGDWSSLFTEPVAIIVYVLMVVLLLDAAGAQTHAPQRRDAADRRGRQGSEREGAGMTTDDRSRVGGLPKRAEGPPPEG